jgi:hypothetical protein
MGTLPFLPSFPRWVIAPGKPQNEAQHPNTKQPTDHPGAPDLFGTCCHYCDKGKGTDSAQYPLRDAAPLLVCHALTVGHPVTNMHTSGTAYRYIQGAGAAADTRSRSAA